jgi:hypothetical protein
MVRSGPINLRGLFLKSIREEFRAGYCDANFKSHKEAIGRTIVHGSILGIAIFYPAAPWKRIVGALLAFFIYGSIIQFRAIRRERSSGQMK